MIGLIARNPYALGALGAAQIFLLSGVYLKGRSDAAAICARARAQAALAAMEEQQTDENAQQAAGAISDIQLRNEIARLTRQLEISDVKTGLDCDAPGSGDSVRDAHRELFETGLPAGDGSDDGGSGAGAPAMETRRGAERR